jgi:hypothetical protein
MYVLYSTVAAGLWTLSVGLCPRDRGNVFHSLTRGSAGARSTGLFLHLGSLSPLLKWQKLASLARTSDFSALINPNRRRADCGKQTRYTKRVLVRKAKDVEYGLRPTE